MDDIIVLLIVGPIMILIMLLFVWFIISLIIYLITGINLFPEVIY